MGTGGLSWRSFAIQYWSRSNRRSHRRTRWASGASCLQSKASTTLSLACAPTAPNSSARWPSTRTSTDSATREALRASSSRWPRYSSEALTAFGETGVARQELGVALHPVLPPPLGGLAQREQERVGDSCRRLLHHSVRVGEVVHGVSGIGRPPHHATDDPAASGRATSCTSLQNASTASAVSAATRMIPRACRIPSSWMSASDASRRSEERRLGKECRSRWSPY